MTPRKKRQKKEVVPAARRSSTLRHVTRSEDFDERRKTARLDVAVKVQYQILGKDEGPKAAVTKDVSVGGCLILVPEELPVNSKVLVQIFLSEDESQALRLKARITRLNRAESDLYEYGITFDQLSNEARRLFADYFFAKMYEGGPAQGPG